MFKEYGAAETAPPVRRQGRWCDAVPAYRKRDLTMFGAPEAALSVDFPDFPRRRDDLTMPHIARVSSSNRKSGKSISVTPYSLNMP